MPTVERVPPVSIEQDRPLSSDEDAWPAPHIGWYVTILLALAYAISFLDRYMIALLVEPIKRDLALSDTQIGLLQGLAFGIFYAVAGLPLGWLVDRSSRRNIVAAGIAGWSAMMAVSGLATNFAMLFIGRAGMGVGEATLSPAGLSLIADHFAAERRNRAISVFMVGATFGSGLSVIVGGTIIGLVSRLPAVHIPGIGLLRPWQMSFIVAGLPGIAVALLLRSIHEPRRRGLVSTLDHMPVSAFFAFLRQRALVFGLLIGGMALYSVAAYAFNAWLPTYFQRVFHWQPQEIAYRYGLPLMGCSALGMIAGGLGIDHLTRRGIASAPLLLMAATATVSIVPAVAGTQMSSVDLSFALILLYSLLGSIPFGLCVAALMLITPNQFRGQIAALYLCSISVMGYGIGPLAVGLLNDHVFTGAAIGNSMSFVSMAVVPVAAGLLILCIKPFARARIAAGAWDASAVADLTSRP